MLTPPSYCAPVVVSTQLLPKGKYTGKENSLPTGYTGSLVSLDCEVKSDETTELKAANQPIQFRIKIVKSDALTKEPLAGAEFTITSKATGQSVATLTTDARVCCSQCRGSESYLQQSARFTSLSMTTTTLLFLILTPRS